QFLHKTCIVDCDLDLHICDAMSSGEAESFQVVHASSFQASLPPCQVAERLQNAGVLAPELPFPRFATALLKHCGRLREVVAFFKGERPVDSRRHTSREVAGCPGKHL